MNNLEQKLKAIEKERDEYKSQYKVCLGVLVFNFVLDIIGLLRGI